jgi:hypothetical protein
MVCWLISFLDNLSLLKQTNVELNHFPSHPEVEIKQFYSVNLHDEMEQTTHSIPCGSYQVLPT